MADINTYLGGITSTLGLSLQWLIGIIALLALLGVIAYWSWNRKQWNIKVEFKLRRSDGKAVYAEWGKGNYKPSRGYAIIKRPGFGGRKYDIKNFDPTVYLQGGDVLTVVQTGATEFVAVVPDSFQEVRDEVSGKTAQFMELKGDATKDRAWATMRTRDLLGAYTIRSFFAQNGQMLGFGMLLIVLIVGLFLGFGMILDRLPQA